MYLWFMIASPPTTTMFTTFIAGSITITVILISCAYKKTDQHAYKPGHLPEFVDPNAKEADTYYGMRSTVAFPYKGKKVKRKEGRPQDSMELPQVTVNPEVNTCVQQQPNVCTAVAQPQPNLNPEADAGLQQSQPNTNPQPQPQADISPQANAKPQPQPLANSQANAKLQSQTNNMDIDIDQGLKDDALTPSDSQGRKSARPVSFTQCISRISSLIPEKIASKHLNIPKDSLTNKTPECLVQRRIQRRPKSSQKNFPPYSVPGNFLLQ